MGDLTITSDTLIWLAVIILGFGLVGMIARVARGLATVALVAAAVIFAAGIVSG